MNGRDFLAVAIHLAARAEPADRRSATSRAYYAAFHAVRDFFLGCGIHFSQSSPEAHSKMPQCLENLNIPQASELGRRLSSLRSDRNGADYHMEDPKFEKEANTKMRIQIATEILASVDELLTEPTRSNVSSILRSKARALGIHVVDTT